MFERTNDMIISNASRSNFRTPVSTQPLNYLLCLKFRAMIKFQRFVCTNTRLPNTFVSFSYNNVCPFFLSVFSRIESSSCTFSSVCVSVFFGFVWKLLNEKRHKMTRNNGSKFLKWTSSIKDSVRWYFCLSASLSLRFCVGILIPVLYLHKSHTHFMVRPAISIYIYMYLY